MQLSRDRVYLGSCSHDKTIRFWNVNGIANGGAASTSMAGDDDDMEEDSDSDADSDAMDAAHGAPAVRDIRQNNFFDDL
jgi:WD40 repeat protein